MPLGGILFCRRHVSKMEGLYATGRHPVLSQACV